MMLPVRVWHRLTAKDGVVAAGEGEITVPIGAGERRADGAGLARSAGAARRQHADRQLADVPGAQVENEDCRLTSSRLQLFRLHPAVPQ